MLTLTLPFPPSANHYWRHVGPRVLLSREGRAYRTLVAKCVQDQRGGPRRPLAGRLQIVMRVYPPDRRRRDLDNLRKALWDALTAAGVWLDDSQVDDDRAVRCEPVKGGAVTVEIVELQQQEAA